MPFMDTSNKYGLISRERDRRAERGSGVETHA
jgi:hypothetical protein